jgi:hypothetical protein
MVVKRTLMSEETLQEQLAEARETIRTLQQELAETNREVMALTLDLEERVEQRTAELREANRQLEQEVAERRRVEKALRQSEERFRVVMKSSSIVAAITDRDLRYVWIQNPHRDFDPEGVIGKRDDELADNEGARQLMRLKRKVLAREKGVRTEITFPLGDDSVTYDITAEPMRDAAGEVIGVTTAALDITARKRAEEELERYSEHLEDMVDQRTRELRESQERMAETLTLNETIIEASSLGITAYETSGDCVLANEPAARILGATREQVLDQNFRCIDSWQESNLLQAAETALDEERRTREEAHIVSTFGRDVWLDCRFVPFTLNGETRLLVVTDDVTERKRLQEQLIRQEKLATLGRLSGSVSHELRNPLGAIRNAAYFLQLVIDNPDPDVEEALGILEREVDRSEAVIKAMLDFARLEPPVRREVDLNDVLERTLERLEIPSEIEVAVRLDDGVCGIPGDPDQLGEVFFNIADNAIDAMPDGGRLMVESEATSDQEVTVSISDTGSGIPKRQQEQIFEPLFTTKAQGIGLGLAIVKTLVEGHGGTVEVESPAAGLEADGESRGTTFTVRLPLGGGKEADRR